MDRFWMAPGGLHIEPAIAKDAETVARLHAQGFHHGWPVEEFTAYLTDPQQTPAYIACDAKRRISGFMMLRHAADEVELLTIAVEPKRRGKGLGRALLAAGLADLMRTRARRMFLEVAEDNASAIALYRRHGFAEIGRRRGYYPRPDGTPATALVMARDLS